MIEQDQAVPLLQGAIMLLDLLAEHVRTDEETRRCLQDAARLAEEALEGLL